MSETKVYRIEHPTIIKSFGNFKLSVGPYYIEGRDDITTKLSNVVNNLVDMHNISSEHPSLGGDIDNELISDINYKLVAACPSISALQYWFGELLDEGMVIVEYTIEKSYIGNSNIQCGFDPEHIISFKQIS